MPFIGKQPEVGAYSKLDAITTSATATYNLTLGGGAYYPSSANHLLVSLNGVMQAPQDSFTVSGSTIVFDSALTSSDNIDFIMALGDVLDIGTPSDGTVTSAKLSGPLTTPSNLTVGGTATLNSTLAVSGATTLNSTLTTLNDIAITASSGNPKVSIKTAGTGNNTFTEYRAGDNTVFDTMGVFSNTPDYWRVGYGASGSVTTELMKAFKDGAVVAPLQPQFHVRLSGNQTGYNGFTSSQWGEQYIEWNYEEYDIGGGYTSNGTNIGKFFAPVAGTYYFETAVYANSFSSGAWNQAWFNVNGGRHPGTDFVVETSSGTSFIQWKSIIKLNAGDNVAVHPYPTSSSSTSVTILANANHSWFKGILLS